MNVVFIVGTNITTYINGKAFTSIVTPEMAEKAAELAAAGKYSEIAAMCDPEVAFKLWADAYGVERDSVGNLRLDGKNLPSSLADRIYDLASAGKQPDSLVNFWRKLSLNPSWRVKDNLFKFITLHKIPLSPEGDIIAFKAVRSDGYDIHSGTIHYEVGKTVALNRGDVSDDPDEGCHFGLHVGSADYALDFGSSTQTFLICRVDPADAVCVPYDVGYSKLRTCRLTVERFWDGRSDIGLVYTDHLQGNEEVDHEEPEEVDEEPEEVDEEPEEVDEEPEEVDEEPVQVIDLKKLTWKQLRKLARGRGWVPSKGVGVKKTDLIDFLNS